MLQAVDIPFDRPADGGASAATREFRKIDDGAYVFGLLELGIEFRVDFLRRERFELIGELLVRCDLPGARTVGTNNTLSCGTLNFSSTRARSERAKLLADLSKAPELDWARLMEEFTQQVLSAERAGQPAVLLPDLPRPTADETFSVEGLRLLKRHPVILFGDGGTAKSYLALYIAGCLARHGVRVGVFDWELAGEDHRDRLERLFGPAMPAIWYARCERPLLFDVERLRRIRSERQLDYVVYDSVAFAAHDKPEASESASAYFRGVRQIGAGSLHIAHVTKSDAGDQKPFGSIFWHNSARATWFVQRGTDSNEGGEITIGLFNRKANLGALQAPFGLRFAFDDDRTTVTRVNLAAVEDLAAKIPIRQRMAHLLRRGPLTIAKIAEELDANPDTVARKLRCDWFVRLTDNPDGVHRYALAERRSA